MIWLAFWPLPSLAVVCAAVWAALRNKRPARPARAAGRVARRPRTWGGDGYSATDTLIVEDDRVDEVLRKR